MSNETKRDDKSSWAIGGSLMMGIGAGFFVLHYSALYFVGCIMLGLGLGLVLAAVLSRPRHEEQ